MLGLEKKTTTGSEKENNGNARKKTAKALLYTFVPSAMSDYIRNVLKVFILNK